MVIVALVMMNLLISLISDSYANVQSNFREYLVRERASLILEIYDFLDAKWLERTCESTRWLHILEIASDDGTNKGEDSHHLSQKLIGRGEVIADQRAAVDQQTQKLAEMIEALNETTRRQFDEQNSRFADLEGRLGMVLASVRPKA